MKLADLQKALDTIEHEILLLKLYALGFYKHSVNWFRSYLINITFLVNFGNMFCQPACHKQSNVIFSFALMAHAWLFNIKILKKMKICRQFRQTKLKLINQVFILAMEKLS